jgi:hypothetical protein
MLAGHAMKRAVQMAGIGTHILQFGYGLTMTCAFPATGSVDVTITLGRLKLLRHRFSPHARGVHVSCRLPVLEADFRLTLNAFTGQLIWEGDLRIRREPSGRWKTLFAGTDVLVQFDPGLGLVDGRPDANAPVTSGRFGPGQLCTPVVLRFHVAGADRAVSHVGCIVKEELFRSYPPFTFNTVACVGAVSPGAQGLYTNPESIWFNVFFGYYQLDCAKQDGWIRPFAYDSANGFASSPVPEDVARLGKADWNWFSNWMYGVPAAECAPYSQVDMTAINVIGPSAKRIGSKRFHEIRLNGVEVASAYESDAKGATKLVENSVLAPVWRKSFGLPHPRPNHPVSFIPTALDAVVEMSYFEDADAFHTVMFGATAGRNADPTFMDAQLAAVRQVMVDSYPGLGFT